MENPEHNSNQFPLLIEEGLGVVVDNNSYLPVF